MTDQTPAIRDGAEESVPLAPETLETLAIIGAVFKQAPTISSMMVARKGLEVVDRKGALDRGGNKWTDLFGPMETEALPAEEQAFLRELESLCEELEFVAFELCKKEAKEGARITKPAQTVGDILPEGGKGPVLLDAPQITDIVPISAQPIAIRNETRIRPLQGFLDEMHARGIIPGIHAVGVQIESEYIAHRGEWSAILGMRGLNAPEIIERYGLDTGQFNINTLRDTLKRAIILAENHAAMLEEEIGHPPTQEEAVAYDRFSARAFRGDLYSGEVSNEQKRSFRYHFLKETAREVQRAIDEMNGREEHQVKSVLELLNGKPAPEIDPSYHETLGALATLTDRAPTQERRGDKPEIIDAEAVGPKDSSWGGRTGTHNDRRNKSTRGPTSD